MSPLANQHNPSRYWRSLADVWDTPEFRRHLEAEFPEAAEPAGMPRRRWLQLMGASVALAGVGGCRWEKAEILPFAERPPERIPGKPQHFATVMEFGGDALGLVVTCVDGRPIKIEGNPKHPSSLGATDAIAQAAILELYDPDRSQLVVERTGGQEIVRSEEELDQFLRDHFGALRETRGAGFRVLSEPTSSPTLAAMRNRLLKQFPQAQWHEYDPLGSARPGPPLRFAVDKADVIVCLDDDLFGSGPGAVRYARQFADGRDPNRETMNRLYVVESRVSITGAAADHRLPLRSDHVAGFVTILEQEITALLKQPDATEVERGDRRQKWLLEAMLEDVVSTVLGRWSHAIELKYGEPRGGPPERTPDATGRLVFLFAMAEDLVANRGSSVVTVGPSQPAAVHAAVARINAALDNVGKTVLAMEPSPGETTWRGQEKASIQPLTAAMSGGEVSTLLILGGNPVYNAPADLEFAEALRNVDTSIHLSLYRNETSRKCTWHVPQAHFLESWGDARAHDGTYSVVQPMIEPLFGGKSAIELLAILLDDELTQGRDLVQKRFQEILAEREPGAARAKETERRWRRTLHDGLLADSAWGILDGVGETSADSGSQSLVELMLQPLHSAKSPVESPATSSDGEYDDLEVVFVPDAKAHDGRLANNGWLQEMPDPITRLTWGNAALFSPATAKELGVEDQTLVKLSYDNREVEIPAYVMPGQAYRSVAVQLGYGRTVAGHVGGLEGEAEPVGVDVYPLRTSEAMHFGTGLVVEPTGKKVPLATVQDHFAIDAVGAKARERRAGTLIREATLEHYREHPDFARHAVHHPPLESLWKEHEYQGYRWGMSIDLSKCIGCGACVVACQAENNVPIVGREQVLRGRQMHWLRVDRYFKGDPEDPQLVLQPVACHHCELAPCEQVCPVGATVHDAQGLNVMVYNRCVGTRYCANNCLYKVRRFNYFNYHKDLAEQANEVVKMAYNPEVTVRSRGVMEKCTYCVQRIKAATIEAKNQGRRIGDGQVKTACQQACPTGAIVFGDLGDEKSAVARSAENNRSYAMLAELNVKPRTVYLARIRNPNSKLEEGSHRGGTEEHGENKT